jgi:ABC-2 type transport system permease protein
MRRIRAIAYKEMLHILRDSRSLGVAILMPLVLVVLFGFALDMELKDLKVGILDLDHSAESRELIRTMTSSSFIVDAGRLVERAEVEPGFRQGRFQAALVIPAGYGRDLAAGRTAQVQLLIDGADASTATTVDNYLRAVIERVNADLCIEGSPPVAGPQPTLRILFNAELVSRHFIVPGLVALILIMICALLTSIAITREKETGTLEQVLTTPVRPGQVIVGKLVPYLVLGAFDAALILIVGRLLFEVPMRGSILALTGYSLLYVMISLAIGLLISALVKTQRVALLLALSMTMLPALILSGFIFPVRSMPLPLQGVAHLIPATYFLRIIRGIMLVGRDWYPLEGGVMLIMAIGLLTLATRRFGTKLE